MFNSYLNNQLKVDMKVLDSFCKQYQVRELSLFGSVAKGQTTQSSDVDILVEFQPHATSHKKLGFMTLSKMQRELSAILQNKVDLVPKNGLKPRIKKSILSEAKILYAA
ncbi:MAG: nucleotidyltransferase family protein [Gammaproteobacteria bacterium]|nr:nucleotidyltransferase family protein [Gammaproteobacteria bacterium]